MTDPLAEIVTHLRPAARFAKVVGAAGRWQITRDGDGQPFYLLILGGECRLTLTGVSEPIVLTEGDFILVPGARGARLTSLEAPPAGAPDAPHTVLPDGAFRVGSTDGPAQVQWLLGYFAFGSPDAALLVALLPDFVLVRSQPRLTTLVQLVIDETRDERPARDVVLSRLLEVLLVEALRSTATATAPGLLRGLSDGRLASALRALHQDPARAWTVAELAAKAALSRSAFFARFAAAVGLAPMDYLKAWRMALAKSLLRQNHSVTVVAGRVGYGSASAFSTAFTRHVGTPPARYAEGG
ncbi:AraC family transcriptional regulator [Tabrizicola aquatica]|uniref:AraC family transcriptional regulator n=1 Tax=Tabrizicola aquatica TaxID=909926 RepID=UPI000CD10BFF|nr:AraC family transcriptional regulator [Tabrizicola aquatica]